MNRPILTLALALAALTALIACGDDEPSGPVSTEPRAGTLVVEPMMDLPDSLADVGLYPDLRDLNVLVDTAIAYEPAWPLWSNGLTKHRYVVLPEGTTIDTSNREIWSFPVGTLAFKTFVVADPDDADGWRPYETRIMRRLDDRWEFASYLWNERGTRATLHDMRLPVQVDVTLEDGTTFVHEVPNQLQCRKCHESNPAHALGLSELQLNHGASETELARFARLGLVESAPSDAAAIAHEDPLTEQVLGYFVGNCTHCHNGSDGPSASFDLRGEAGLTNTIDQPTESSATIPGIRVIPGNPDESVLWRAVAGDDRGAEELKLMPPVGVQHLDAEGIDLLAEWIESLEPTSEDESTDE